MKRIVILLCIGLGVIAMMASPAIADVIYTYTGNTFNYLDNTTISGSLSGSFTLATALAPNLSSAVVNPLSYDFTDGITSLTPADSSIAHFNVSTDSHGGIVANWYIDLRGTAASPQVSILSQGTPLPYRSVDDVLYYWGVGNYFEKTSSGPAGTWQTADPPASTPEPGTMLLLGTGLIGLWGARRKLKK